MSENKKAEKIVGVKGMNDILPADAPLWELFENTVYTVLKSYGFQQIRTPIVEPTALFSRAWVKSPISSKKKCIHSLIR